MASRCAPLGAVILLGLILRPAAAADGQLALVVLDDKTRQPIACRMHLVGPGSKPRRIEQVPFWSDHFVFPGKITLKLPVGRYTFELERGPEYKNVTGNFKIDRSANDTKEISLPRAVDMAAEGWWSGDLCVHRPLPDVKLLMAAEDLHVAGVISWWNDRSQVSPKALAALAFPTVLFDGNRAYEPAGGGYGRSGTEVLCFHLRAPLLLPPDAGPEYPALVQQLMKVRRGADPPAWIDLAATTGRDLPLLAAHHQVDSIEIANRYFCRRAMLADQAGEQPGDRQRYAGPLAYARWSQDIYFKLLECGLRIPPTAGSGSGVSPNPVGYNRVYVHLDGPFSEPEWWRQLRAGRVVVTNGPLLRPTVDGQLPGYVFQGEEGRELELEIGLTLSTADAISYLDIIQDGAVRQNIRFEDYAKSGRLPKLHVKKSGWFLLRAVSDVSQTYRFALSGPYYVEFGGQPRISRKAAQFFLDWVYRLARQISLDDPQEHREVLELHRQARDFWQAVVARANAE
ncbi:MAG: hypothetical protein ABSF26_03370 [Thermoguttaceae bacterium]|jgi:hypothetical protein